MRLLCQGPTDGRQHAPACCPSLALLPVPFIVGSYDGQKAPFATLCRHTQAACAAQFEALRCMACSAAGAAALQFGNGTASGAANALACMAVEGPEAVTNSAELYSLLGRALSRLNVAVSCSRQGLRACQQ